MKELKCPNCGSVFSVDEADYAAIVSQVKSTEFQQELERRVAELHEKHQAELENKELKAKQDYERRLGAKDAEIVRLTGQVSSAVQAEQLKYNKELAQRDTVIEQLKAQAEQQEQKVQVAILQEQNKAKDAIQTKDAQIASVKDCVIGAVKAHEPWALNLSKHEHRLKELYKAALVVRDL